jgi:hypothetical protein
MTLDVQGMTDKAPTAPDRPLGAGIDPEQPDRYLASGTVVFEGERVTDADPPAAPPARVVLKPA